MSCKSVYTPCLTEEEKKKIEEELQQLLPPRHLSEDDKVAFAFVSDDLDRMFEDLSGVLKKDVCEDEVGESPPSLPTTTTKAAVEEKPESNSIDEDDNLPDLVACDSDDEEDSVGEWSGYYVDEEEEIVSEGTELSENNDKEGVEDDNFGKYDGVGDVDENNNKEKYFYQLSKGEFIPGMRYDATPCGNCDSLKHSLEEKKKVMGEEEKVKTSSTLRNDNYMMNKAMNVSFQSEKKVSYINNMFL